MYNFTDEELVIDCFDKLIAQGGFSISESAGCVYRSENGKKCAAGHYIPDEDYEKVFEEKICMVDNTDDASAEEEKTISARISSILTKQGLDPVKIRRLQIFHDEASSAVNDNQQVQFLSVVKEYILAEMHNRNCGLLDVYIGYEDMRMLSNAVKF